MRQEEIQRLSNERLAELCAEQTLLFEKEGASDSRYCYELIRRAVFGIEGAWEAIDAQYRPWVHRKVARYCQGSPDDIEELVQETLIRFLSTVTSDRWKKFPNLPRLLGFLGTCARNLALNHRRDEAQRRKRERAFPEDEWSSLPQAENPRHRLEYHQWQEQVRRCVSQKFPTPRDRRLVVLCWGYDLRPREIHAQYADEFPSMPELYKRIRNLKDRIRRDPDCAALLGEMP
ncbi:MAG: RNA polymerase sigma factor [Chloroflexi bacterium]|nr:RNA polymerase sigma factor [Chloroflexota bacterium]